MIKLRAKKMLIGGYLKSFFACFLPLMLSTFSLAVVFGALYASVNSTIFVAVSQYSGKDSAPYIVLGVCTAVICVFVFLFAKGKLYYNSYIRRKTTAKTKSALKNDGAIRTFRILTASIMKFLFTLAWGFLFLSPFLVTSGSLYYRLVETGLAKNMSTAWGIGSGVLLFIGLFFTFTVTQRYSAWYLLLSENNNTVVKAMQQSVEITEGQCLKIAFFKLSMLPWLLLCVFILPAVYIIPYYSFSVGILIRCLEKKSDKPVQKEKPIIFKKLEAGY